MSWKPNLPEHVREFNDSERYITTPWNKYPIYSEQLYTRSESDTLFHRVMQDGFPNHTHHTVYKENGVEGQLDRSVRDTHDLSNALTYLRNQGVNTRLREASERGTAYITGATVKLRPAVSLQILGYERLGKFISHADSHIYTHTPQGMGWINNSPERKFSGICWLSQYVQTPGRSNEFNGGIIRFPYLNDAQGKVLEIRPQAGQFVLFPSHPLYTHEILPVIRGYRVALVFFWDKESV